MTGAPGARPEKDVARDNAPRAGAPTASQPIGFRAMRAVDLAEVEAVERHVYSHPWSMGNFQDSLASGYQCWVAHDEAGVLAGYFMLMPAPDEAHLLNITVVPAFQGRGVGRFLLDRAASIARSIPAPAILLEVRPSNTHALAVYGHVGFRQIGIRKAYYPAAGMTREDAIVMRLAL